MMKKGVTVSPVQIYAVVRKTEGELWVDTTTFNYLPDQSMAIAESTNKRIPHWSNDNPIVEVRKFSVTEIADE